MKNWSLINELAEALHVPAVTRRGWKHRGVVPHHRRLAILALARRRKKRLSPKAFGNGSGK